MMTSELRAARLSGHVGPILWPCQPCTHLLPIGSRISGPDRHIPKATSTASLPFRRWSTSRGAPVLGRCSTCTAAWLGAGVQLHTIDINIPRPWQVALAASCETVRVGGMLDRLYVNSVGAWARLFKKSGVRFEVRIPRTLQLLDRSVLVESPDVVYRRLCATRRAQTLQAECLASPDHRGSLGMTDDWSMMVSCRNHNWGQQRPPAEPRLTLRPTP